MVSIVTELELSWSENRFTFVRIFLVVYNVIHPSMDIRIWHDDRVFCNSEIRKPEISYDDFTIWIVLGIKGA